MAIDPHRDAPLERLLQAAAALPLPSSSCVDAAQLAAWAEGTLRASEAAQIEAHLADCDRCQSVVAAFAATEDEPAQQVPVVTPRWPSRAARWVLPIGAAAAASLFLWLSLDRQPDAPSAVTQSARVEPAPERAAASPGPAPAPPAARGGGTAQNAPNTAGARTTSAQRNDLAGAAPSKSTDSVQEMPAAMPDREPQLLAAPPVAPSPDTPAPAASSSNAPAPAASSSPGRLASALPPPPAAAPPPPMPENGNAAPIEAPTSAPVTARAARNAPGPAATADLDRIYTAAGNAAVVTEFVTASMVPTSPIGRPSIQGRGGAPAAAAGPSPAPARASNQAPTRWRILANGTVQRSVTNGASWTIVDIPPTPGLMTGTSPSPSVAWLAGRNGVVLVLVVAPDGTTSAVRRDAPGAPNLVAVRADDALRAVVTTSEGRSFSTANGGASWAPN